MIEIRSLTGATLLTINAADLRGADLRGAYLQYANLQYADLQYANLQGADLQGADLQGADLRGADLQYANLQAADLQCAHLQYANLRGAHLQAADLQYAHLQYANLRGADLRGANLQGAHLQYANLRGADLRGANLQGAKNANLVMAQTKICPDGHLVGWKMASYGRIVQLLIPADAKRSNATGRKCRAEYAEVVAIFDGDQPIDAATSAYDTNFLYRVGETVVPTKPFDEDRWNECSTGIHFYITREEAENHVC